jgi:hypothetical protein
MMCYAIAILGVDTLGFGYACATYQYNQKRGEQILWKFQTTENIHVS